MNNIKIFFTPIKYDTKDLTISQKIEQIVDNYLSFGGRKIIVIPSEDSKNLNVVRYREKALETRDYFISALKIVSFCTVVLPFCALLFKSCFRASHNIKDQTNQEPKLT